MNISENGIKFIANFEGCRLDAYLCPASVKTIGIGETGKFALTGKTIELGMKITQKQAYDSFRIAIKKYENAVNNLGIEFNQNQYDALVSFCYNLGTGIFKGNLLQVIKTKNWNSVANQLLLYDKARVNGVLQQLKGLTRRRKAEAELFLTPCEATQSTSKVKVNLFGTLKTIDAINKENTNYVKLRDLNCEKLKVGYNGNPTVNGKILKLDKENTILLDGNNYVRVRFLEELGFSVGYDSKTKIIEIK